MYRSAAGPRGRRRAQRLLDEGERIAAESGDPYLRAWALGTRGICDYLVGRFAEVVTPLLEAERLLEQHVVGVTWELNNMRVFLLWALWYLGRYREAGALLRRYLRDARRRGDRFVETSLVRGFNDYWLVLDDPQRAREELDSTSWAPPETGFLHLQHAYMAWARASLSLYGDPRGDDAEAARRAVDAVGRSQLVRVQVVRVHWARLTAALWLTAPPDPRAVKRRTARLTRRLAGEGVGYASGFALLVRAACARRAGDDARAVSVLREAIDACERGQVFAYAAAARRRLGELLGGDEGSDLLAGADAWMSKAGVRNPERFTRLLSPGFE